MQTTFESQLEIASATTYQGILCLPSGLSLLKWNGKCADQNAHEMKDLAVVAQAIRNLFPVGKVCFLLIHLFYKEARSNANIKRTRKL